MRLHSLSWTGAKPIFYKDDLTGKFSGNVLEKIALLFPHPYSERVVAHAPVYAEWKVYERITWEGAHGYRYYPRKGTTIKILDVMKSIYDERHQLKDYPGIFDGSKDNLPSFVLNVDYELLNREQEMVVNEEYFVIWLPEKVEISRR